MSIIISENFLFDESGMSRISDGSSHEMIVRVVDRFGFTQYSNISVPAYDHQIFMSSLDICEKNVYCRVFVQSHVNDLDSKYNLLRDPVS